MSMPVTVRLTWSPAAAQSRGSSCRVIPATRLSGTHCRHEVALFDSISTPGGETGGRNLSRESGQDSMVLGFCLSVSFTGLKQPLILFISYLHPQLVKKKGN